MEAATTTDYPGEPLEVCPARERRRKEEGSKGQLLLSQMRDENDDDELDRYRATLSKSVSQRETSVD